MRQSKFQAARRVGGTGRARSPRTRYERPGRRIRDGVKRVAPGSILWTGPTCATHAGTRVSLLGLSSLGPGGRRLRGLPLSRSGVPLATRSFSSLLFTAQYSAWCAQIAWTSFSDKSCGRSRGATPACDAPSQAPLPSRFAIMRPI